MRGDDTLRRTAHPYDDALKEFVETVLSHGAPTLSPMPDGDIANDCARGFSTGRAFWWEITPLTFGRARLVLTNGFMIEDGY